MVDIFGHLCLMLPALAILLYYSWPSVRRAWSILEGPISVGGVPASFLLKSLIPAFCVLLLIQGLSALIRDLIRLGGKA
jgi:TRAP-type mannitol/chloroaromatic compound transport system permease small subunit